MKNKTNSVFVLGPPGSGKTTIITTIKSPDILHISTGDILRYEIARDKSLGKLIKSYINEGKLVPSKIILELISKELKKNYKDEKTVIFFDGFPRSMSEVESFFETDIFGNIILRAIILLSLPKKENKRRIKERRFCPNCGEIYNLRYRQPIRKDARLEMRADDKIEIIKKQIKEFNEWTVPAIKYLKKNYIDLIIEKNVDKPIYVVLTEILISLQNFGINLLKEG